MLSVEFSGAEQLSGNIQLWWKCFFCYCTQQQRRPHTSHMSWRDISMADPSPLSTVWLGQLQKQLQSRSRGEAALGVNLHPREASKQSLSRKPPQPTLWECNWMIACTHHAAFDVWTLGLAKAFATLRLSMITICKLQASFLFTESHALSLGLTMHWSKSVKSCDCDQRSWPSFHPWSHSNCRISAITSLSLGRRTVFNRIPVSKLTMQGFHAAFH